MEELVKEGRARISKAFKITKAVGNFAAFILKAKGIVDLAVQGNPQAALPWAGCLCWIAGTSTLSPESCLVS